MIRANHSTLSIRRQCKLLNINRSVVYYKAKSESEYNQKLMKLLDEEYTRHPFLGVNKLVKYLENQGHAVNHKRVRRLLRNMGLIAIYPQSKKRSQLQIAHKKYPYLLNELEITKPNQVFCADITYVRLVQGFVYLIAIMDWYSRYVLSCKISNTLDTSFCIEALQDALSIYGYPDIFNTDQGSQFTSEGFTGILLANGIKISMDGKGRAYDNIFIERLWRTIKQEEIYIHDYASIKEVNKRLEKYFEYYNFERCHQALDYKTPAEVYFGKKPMEMWMSPSDQLKPFGTCGQDVNNLMENAKAFPTGSSTTCPHSLASHPQLNRLNNNKFY